ncbi:MAG: hypothetical protein JXC33_07610 [Deltaproteobacteria bacterium]|nr:hypothetical protein [Deltaproteobacteria bacterium]
MMLDAVLMGEVAFPFLLSAGEMDLAHADHTAAIAKEVASLVRTDDEWQVLLRLAQSADHLHSFDTRSFAGVGQDISWAITASMISLTSERLRIAFSLSSFVTAGVRGIGNGAWRYERRYRGACPSARLFPCILFDTWSNKRPAVAPPAAVGRSV